MWVSGGLMLAAGVTLAYAATPAAPTYTGDVAKILYKNCARCHRQDGAAARIPLDSYQAVKLNVSKMREKVETGAMPPWPADPAQSLPMKNDSRMTPEEIRKILDWIDAGAPKGADADFSPQPAYNDGWLHPDNRPPDWVASLPKFSVPPNGTIPYVRQLIKVPYRDDMWISALQVRAGNTALLHHMGVTEVALPEGVTPDTLDVMDTFARAIGAPSEAAGLQQPVVVDPINPGSYDMLGVYTPGTTFESYGGEGHGKILKGGENFYLNFNIHYTTTGRVEADQTQLAVWFQSRPPDHVLYRAPTAVGSILANGRELLADDPGTKAEGTHYAIPPIPANGRNYELIGMTAYRSPITIYQLQPHAHVRAVDFRYTAIYPDGHEQVILTVPHYSYHFQLEYALATPLVLPGGSKVIVRARYDNSPNNEHLRDLGANDAARRCGPENVAFFGQQNQSWDEMFTPFIQYSANERRAERLGLVSAVGCLAHEPAGQWELRHGSDATPTSTQGTSSTELATSSAAPFGARQYELLGVDVFNPAKRVGNKVVAKGVLIPTPDGDRINVTSLQSTPLSCPE
jgi:hypothetical protein